MTTEGISGYLNRLWALQQHILVRWGVYTIFEEQTPIVPLGTRGYVRWLVPLDVPACDEIMEFVKHELADMREEDLESHHGTFPGTDVEVRPEIICRFNGVQPYVERDVLEKMVKSTLDRLLKTGKFGKDKAEDHMTVSDLKKGTYHEEAGQRMLLTIRRATGKAPDEICREQAAEIESLKNLLHACLVQGCPVVDEIREALA